MTDPGSAGKFADGVRNGAENVSDPVYAPNSYGGPKADPARTDEAGLWYADGDMVRKAYTLRAEDDDLVRPAPWCVTYSTTRRVRVW